LTPQVAGVTVMPVLAWLPAIPVGDGKLEGKCGV